MMKNMCKKMLAVILAAACLLSLGAPALAAIAEDDWVIYPLITQDNEVTRNPDPEAPAPWGAVPDDAQLLYHEQELAGFIHFGVNTFIAGQEWGSGTENPHVFNPTAMTTQAEADAVAEEWVQAFKDGGFKRVILVGKHHDGFCIWPTEYTERDTDGSSVPGVDVVWAVSKACTKLNIDMGFYLSPWDESAISYGYRDANGNALTKAQEAQKIESGELDPLMDYNYYYDCQLREVLGNDKYGRDGHFVEVWMDGAKGSGALAQDYDFSRWFRTIKELEPGARTFSSIAGCGIRWSGNEMGTSGAETCWQKMDVDAQGEIVPSADAANKAAHYLGRSNGSVWSVNECDVSIRSGWFHGPQRSFDAIMDMYYNNVGHSSVFLLNLPPDTTGHFVQSDIDLLRRFNDALTATYATNFAAASNGATAETTQGTERTSATAGKFSAAKVLDEDNDTYWTLQDGATSGQITIDLGRSRQFDLISLQEYIPLGQRIAETLIEYSSDGENWRTFKETTTIGARRIVVDTPVTAQYVRVTVTNTDECTGVPLLSSIGVYKASADMERSSGIRVPEGATFKDDRDAMFSYTGSWTEHNNADGERDTHKGSGTVGNHVDFTFTGSQFYVTGIVDPNHGPVEVTIDGTVVGTFDTHATARKTKQVLYVSPALSYGSHTVKLTVKSATKPYLDFDGIYILEGRNGILEFAKSSYSVREGGDVTLTIRRAGGTDSEVSFRVTDLPGSAVSGQHYRVVDETITMAAGQTEATVTAHSIAGSGIGKMFTLQIISPTGGAELGGNDTADIHILDPRAEMTVAPVGANFTAADPFPMPDKAGQVNKTEAEHLELDSSEVVTAGQEVRISAGPGNGRHVSWFEDGNKIYLHYNAPKAGTYTMAIRYGSGRGSNNPNYVNWRGDHVQSGSKSVYGTSSDGSAYATAEVTLEINQAGPGTLEFYADSHGEPSLDWFSFRLEPVAVQSISLDPNQATIYTNAGLTQTVTLTPVFNPADSADGATVTWSSNNESVATVNENGVVTAVAAGNATITATATGNKTATCAITVVTNVTPPTDVDKTALTQALTTANAAKNTAGLQTKPNGTTASQVDRDVQFVTVAEMQALTNAITDAQTVADNTNATQTEVDNAKNTLTAAVETFNRAIKTGTKEPGTTPPDPVNKDALTQALTTANAAKDTAGLQTKPDGTTEAQVDRGVKFVTTSEMQALTNAIIAAQAVADDTNATQTDVDNAKNTLTAAVETFNRAIKTGTKEAGTTPGAADKTALTQALAAANTAKEGVATKPDGTTASQVNKGAKFVTATDMQTLNNFVTLAESVASNANATQADVDAIVTMLTGAVDTFKGAVKTGTKETSTPTPPSPGPSGPSPSPSRPSTPVSEKRDDGNWVTTATKTDGTKVETVEQRNGTTAEKVTDPKKNVTITVTDPDGEELAKVEIPAVLPKAETKFDDVPEGHWAEDAIQTAVALGISKGVGDNKYDLTAPMTRGSLAAVLHRLSQGKTDYDVTFKDVAKGKYYTEGVAWAAKANVVKGVSEDVFAPDQVITREQLAVMMARYAKLIGMDTKANAKTLEKFADGEKTGAWAVDGVAWCVENGILQGKGGAVLDSTANVTRAEVAVMLQRFLELV